MKTLFLSFLAVLIGGSAAAQSADKNYVYPQQSRPTAIDNYFFSIYYYNGPRVYNLRSTQLCDASGDVRAIKINPSGSTCAVWSMWKNKKPGLVIYSTAQANDVLKRFKLDYVPTAICYAPNARSFAAASTDKKLRIYETRTYTETKRFDLPFEASMLAISENNYFYAVSNGSVLEVFNFETGQLRKSIPVSNKVNFITFAADNTVMGVLTDDGVLTLYDTRTFLPVQEFDGLGVARSCDLHTDGKYVAVVSGDNAISLINKYDPADRRVIECVGGGVSDVRFINDSNERVFLLYNTDKSIVYNHLSGLEPNYNVLLNDEVNEKMNAWLKRMPGESLEEYEARVNDETRMHQRELFETEIATRMADNLLSASTITLGDFNASTNTLALNFNTMPTIHLEVPKSDAAMFSSAADLEFRNAQYGLMADDRFELVYVDVYNKRTDATYTFDKRRKALDYEKLEEDIVSLELVQRSNMEELRLQEITESVVEEAKLQNIISDHTQIDVKTGITPSVNANGEKILNYEIGFTYNVEAGFSAREDFGPGKYHTPRSGAASAMVEIIKKAFEGEFAQYVKEGKKVRVIVTGMADNLPIHGRIAYDGAYGDFVNEPVYGKELYALTVTKATGITANDQLAFMRAAGVKESIEKGVPALSQMDAEYEYHVQLLDKAGGEFRRISVDFVFIDAF